MCRVFQRTRIASVAVAVASASGLLEQMSYISLIDLQSFAYERTRYPD